MRVVNPEIYLIAQTAIADLEKYLASIGRGDWESEGTDADVLSEVAGRLCYRSWGVGECGDPDGENPNVSRVRSGNAEYLANIMKQMHGSVLEHASFTFLFKNVSRVLTHELVRHRAGMAYSQESLRFIRLTDLGYWLPCDMPEFVNEAYKEVFEFVEAKQKELAERLKMDRMTMGEKKIWTSRLRRLVPMGVCSSILVTGNVRAWFHIATMRSSEGAEEEIRLIQSMLYPIFMKLAPSVFRHLGAFERGV